MKATPRNGFKIFLIGTLYSEFFKNWTVTEWKPYLNTTYAIILSRATWSSEDNFLAYSILKMLTELFTSSKVGKLSSNEKWEVLVLCCILLIALRIYRSHSEN